MFFAGADSRVAAEIVFDCDLGYLLVVRTAGHVIDPGALGSVEFGVAMDIPLVVIFGHDSSGVVSAAVEAVGNSVIPGAISGTSSNASRPVSWQRVRPVCRAPTRSRPTRTARPGSAERALPPDRGPFGKRPAGRGGRCVQPADGSAGDGAGANVAGDGRGIDVGNARLRQDCEGARGAKVHRRLNRRRGGSRQRTRVSGGDRGGRREH